MKESRCDSMRAPGGNHNPPGVFGNLGHVVLRYGIANLPFSPERKPVFFVRVLGMSEVAIPGTPRYPSVPPLHLTV